jgi:hypothetical protein
MRCQLGALHAPSTASARLIEPFRFDSVCFTLSESPQAPPEFPLGASAFAVGGVCEDAPREAGLSIERKQAP